MYVEIRTTVHRNIQCLRRHWTEPFIELSNVSGYIEPFIELFIVAGDIVWFNVEPLYGSRKHCTIQCPLETLYHSMSLGHVESLDVSPRQRQIQWVLEILNSISRRSSFNRSSNYPMSPETLSDSMLIYFMAPGDIVPFNISWRH